MATLHVSNLHQATTAVDLCKKFQQAGPLESVKLCQDWETNMSLGYGYLNFKHPADAEWALRNFYGHKINERPMVLQWSRTPKPEYYSRRSEWKPPKNSAANHKAGARPAAPRDLREKLNSSTLRNKTGSSAEHRAVTVENSNQATPKSANQARPAAPQAPNRKDANPAAPRDLREKLNAMRARKQAGDKTAGINEKLENGTQAAPKSANQGRPATPQAPNRKDANPAAPRDLREKLNAMRARKQAGDKTAGINEKLENGTQAAPKSAYRPADPQTPNRNRKNANPAAPRDLREKLNAMRAMRQVGDKMPGTKEKLQLVVQDKKVPEKRPTRNHQSPAEVTIKEGKGREATTVTITVAGMTVTIEEGVTATSSGDRIVNVSEVVPHRPQELPCPLTDGSKQTATEHPSESGPCKDKKKKGNFMKRQNKEEPDKKKGDEDKKKGDPDKKKKDPDKKKGPLLQRFAASCRRKLSRMGRAIRSIFTCSPNP